MLKTIGKKRKINQSGSMVVEATLIFPIVIFVVFIMIYFSNLMFINADIESKTMNAAIKGAALVDDPVLYYYQNNKKFPSLKTDTLDTKPYRYVLNGFANEVASSIKDELKKDFGSGEGVFTNMYPKVSNVDVDYKNYFIAANFTVKVTYSIDLPWMSLIGSKYNPTYQVSMTMPVNNAAENIRTVDMTVDILKRFDVIDKFVDKIDKIVSKMKGFKDFLK